MSAEDGRRPRELAVRQQPPSRPRTMADLPFHPQPPVRWFNPGVLARAGLRVVLSVAFGAYLDKRELQEAIPEEPLLDQLKDRQEVWFDFISDTGDGFEATYSLAWLASRPNLAVPGVEQPLPRGSVLVLGGDEVYPTAGPTEYENRFVGPYTAASPWLPDTESPYMFVLPGNHDWYDGLTTFMRIFCQRKWVGAWRTTQSRSYFAVPLPHRWWLWGVDLQLDTYIDEPQLRYFERVAKDMEPGDRIILCTAKPSWVDAANEPGAYRNLGYLERQVIRPARAKLMLTLTGDSHHYARYEDAAEGTHKITAGGGGAFLHPTHVLPPHVTFKVDPEDAAAKVYARAACYPEMDRSKRQAVGALRLPLDNPAFTVIPAVVHVLLLLTSLFSIRTLAPFSDLSLARALPRFGLGHLFLGLFRSPLSVLLVLVFLAALVGFAKPPGKWGHGRARSVAKAVMGLAHTALQLGAVLAVAWVSVRLASWVFDGSWSLVLLMVLVTVLGGMAGGLVMGAYLAVCNLLPGIQAHDNEAFSAQRLTGYKNFVRLHVDGRGLLRVYPIGLDRVTTEWRTDGDAEASAPWLAPAGPSPEPHLIEEPLVLDGR